MYDAGKIIIGLIIFLGLVLSPYLYHFGKPTTPPKLEVGTTEKQCVESTPFMRSSHMELLAAWRDQVVREGKRKYVSSTGKEVDISLQNTCTKCHAKKAEFCDRCHNYLSVAPNCWDCHIAPEDKSKLTARSAN